MLKFDRRDTDTVKACEQFRSLICEMLSLSSAEYQSVSEAVTLFKYKKNQVIAEANVKSGHFWFVASGLLRNYYLTNDGKEFNKSFIEAPGFCGSVRELIENRAARFSIQALEPSILVAIPVSWFKQQVDREPRYLALAYQLVQKLALKKEQREAELLLDDAETRYKKFIEHAPSLARRIPAYHIASYLGITEVALSRIKRKISQNS